MHCRCDRSDHALAQVVLTGGPGAGKTAVLELGRRAFCSHVAFLPEAASIVFGGGFWRWKSDHGKKCAQRAIFKIQTELENLVHGEADSPKENSYALAVCDRGTLDGLAYWPGSEKEYFEELGTTKAKEMRRYAAVIHLRTPESHNGYNKSNPVRTETAAQARAIDEKLLKVWEGHPQRVVINSEAEFTVKAMAALRAIETVLTNACPDCGHQHPTLGHG